MTGGLDRCRRLPDDRCIARANDARGLTLIETLAVITILTLVAGVAVGRLGSVHDAADLREAAAQWRDLDRLARLEARCRGPIEMILAAERTQIELRAVGSTEQVAGFDLPSGLTARMEADRPNSAVIFDRRGTSADYVMHLKRAGEIRRWRVHGLTGLIVEMEGAP